MLSTKLQAQQWHLQKVLFLDVKFSVFGFCCCWVWRIIDCLYYSSWTIPERCENSFVDYQKLQNKLRKALLSRQLTTYLRGHNWVHFAHRLIVFYYLEFKLPYLKNLKLFSIRVKELFESIVLRKKNRRRVCALFKSIFLRNRSLSNARLFSGKKTQNLGREIYL